MLQLLLLYFFYVYFATPQCVFHPKKKQDAGCNSQLCNMFTFDETAHAALAEYNAEFERLCGLIDEKLAKGNTDIETERKQAEMQQQSMDLSVRELDGDEKKAGRAYMKQCKAKLQAYQRSALIGSGKGASELDRSKMMDATDKARAGNDRLLQSIKTVQETDAVAGEIENQLADNR